MPWPPKKLPGEFSNMLRISTTAIPSAAISETTVPLRLNIEASGFGQAYSA